MSSPVSTGPTVVLNIRLNGRASVRSVGAALRALQLLGGDGGVDLVEPLRVAPLLRHEHVVGARARLAVAAVGHRIRERRLVAGVLPDQPVHQDGGVEPLHVVAVVDDRAPPGALDVVLQLDAERAVVPGAAEAAVDGGRRKDEAAALGEADDLFERRGGHGARNLIDRVGDGQALPRRPHRGVRPFGPSSVPDRRRGRTGFACRPHPGDGTLLGPDDDDQPTIGEWWMIWMSSPSGPWK